MIIEGNKQKPEPFLTLSCVLRKVWNLLLHLIHDLPAQTHLCNDYLGGGCPIHKPDGGSSDWTFLPGDVCFAIIVKVTYALDLPVEKTDCVRRVTGVTESIQERDVSFAS